MDSIVPSRPPLRTYYLQHRPFFNSLIALAILFFVLIIISIRQAWLGVAMLATAGFILTLFRTGSLLYVFYTTDNPKLGETVHTYAKFPTHADILHIGITEHASTVVLANKLISGMLTVLDPYTPQLFYTRWVNDARTFRLHTYNDPRVRYLESDIELFPFADGEVEMALLEDTLGQLRSRENQREILLETKRVLKEEGLLFIVEWDRSLLAVMLRGLSAVSTPTTQDLHDLLYSVGFERVENAKRLNDVQRLHIYRRPKIHEGHQLEMQFY